MFDDHCLLMVVVLSSKLGTCLENLQRLHQRTLKFCIIFDVLASTLIRCCINSDSLLHQLWFTPASTLVDSLIASIDRIEYFGMSMYREMRSWNGIMSARAKDRISVASNSVCFYCCVFLVCLRLFVDYF